VPERRHRRIRVPFDVNRPGIRIDAHRAADDLLRNAREITRRVPPLRQR
jgi:hypothetical protein